MANKKFVRIQSSKTINVTMGLQNLDVTNPDAHVPDRLRVNPLWPKLTMLIKEGTGWYPSEIAEWNTVKELQKQGILTLGEFSDTCEEENVNESKTKLARNIEEAKKKIDNEKKSKSLLEDAAK